MYSYDSFEYFLESDMLEFLERFGYAFLGIVIGAVVIALMISLVFYILQASGLYTIAKRRALSNAWLAWIPVGNYWIAGSIADQYQYVTKGKIKNKRKVMLILSLAPVVLSVILDLIVSIGMFAVAGTEEAFALTTMKITLRWVLSSVMSVVLMVFWHMALYDLYCSCNPDSAVVFLVLGIFFPVAIPFFIFFSRKKDGGMPPRKPAPHAYVPHEPAYEQPREPWHEPEQL